MTCGEDSKQNSCKVRRRSLEKSRFLVVGGNSGIGRSIVCILDSYGHDVTIYDKNISEDMRNKHRCFQMDLRDISSVENFSNDILPELGINNLVYSAGYQENVDILELDNDSWEKMFRVNVGSAFSISKAVARNIVKERKGTLAYISSIHGEIIREIPHYSASKAAQNMMMKEFAYKLAEFGGRSFSIAPGSIDTPLLRKDLNTEALIHEGENNIPMLRHGSPEEVAKLYYSLLETEYLTGTVVVIDGGLSLII